MCHLLAIYHSIRIFNFGCRSVCLTGGSIIKLRFYSPGRSIIRRVIVSNVTYNVTELTIIYSFINIDRGMSLVSLIFLNYLSIACIGQRDRICTVSINMARSASRSSSNPPLVGDRGDYICLIIQIVVTNYTFISMQMEWRVRKARTEQVVARCQSMTISGCSEFPIKLSLCPTACVVNLAEKNFWTRSLSIFGRWVRSSNNCASFSAGKYSKDQSKFSSLPLPNLIRSVLSARVHQLEYLIDRRASGQVT